MQGIQQHRGFNSVFGRLLERLPDYASLGLVLLAGFLLARLAWMFVPGGTIPTTPTTNVQETGIAPDAANNPANELTTYHLFGQYTTNAPKTTAPAPIQASQLALKLQGVYSRSGSHGYAFIEESGKQKAYAIGETVGSSGAVLEKVFPDHVLLRRNNTLEKLNLPKLGQGISGGGGNAANFAPPMPDSVDMGEINDTNMVEPETMPEMPPQPELQDPNASSGTIPPPLPPTEAPQAAGLDSSNPNMGGMPPQSSNAANNPARLMEIVSPQPYERDGKFVGFQLTPGSNVAMFKQYGLQSGDIVTAVNGTNLDSPATAMQVMQGASTTSQVNLSITRNGQEINLPINLQ